LHPARPPFCSNNLNDQTAAASLLAVSKAIIGTALQNLLAQMAVPLHNDYPPGGSSPSG
jgi:hypothetical protein